MKPITTIKIEAFEGRRYLWRTAAADWRTVKVIEPIYVPCERRFLWFRREGVRIDYDAMWRRGMEEAAMLYTTQKIPHRIIRRTEHSDYGSTSYDTFGPRWGTWIGKESKEKVNWIKEGF